jgi:hypothetical protein
MNPLDIIKKYYTEGSELYKILVSHSRHVTEKALNIAYKHPELALDEAFICRSLHAARYRHISCVMLLQFIVTEHINMLSMDIWVQKY